MVNVSEPTPQFTVRFEEVESAPAHFAHQVTGAPSFGSMVFVTKLPFKTIL